MVMKYKNNMDLIASTNHLKDNIDIIGSLDREIERVNVRVCKLYINDVAELQPSTFYELVESMLSSSISSVSSINRTYYKF